MNNKQRVAVIGSGIAGLTAAWRLSQHHQVEIFEKRNRLGGHTRTLTVPDGPDAGTPIDTGFIVMNHRNYPVLTQLFKEWDVTLEDSDMSFSYHDVLTGYDYGGTTLRGIIPSPARLFDHHHWDMLFDIKRFGQYGTEDLADGSAKHLTLGEFIRKHGLGESFRERYLYAMGAAIWSAPPAALADFPAESYLEFFRNHGLLTLKDRPQWKFVKGGSSSYLDQLRKKLEAEIHLGTTPSEISRRSSGVVLHFDNGPDLHFDQVVIATHADQVLPLLADARDEERTAFGAWNYQANDVVLHSDHAVMPKHKACWASWNFARERGFQRERPVSVSYWMNRLQNLKTRDQYFVTLNRIGEIPEEKIINRTTLYHPQYDRGALNSQQKLKDLNGNNRTWYCGSYFGYGFHEDAAASAQAMVEKFFVS